MNNKKLIIIGIFMLLLTMMAAIDTYALFETNAIGSKNLTIGAWHIELNDEDLSESQTITLDDFIYVNGSHTQSNYFAPGSTAYFDLVVDATGTQVSVEYEFEIDDSSIEDYPNIYFTVTNMATNEVVSTNSYSGNILLSDPNKEKTFRITLVWQNDPSHDATDTSLIGEDLEFTIDANFSQYVGENSQSVSGSSQNVGE